MVEPTHLKKIVKLDNISPKIGVKINTYLKPPPRKWSCFQVNQLSKAKPVVWRNLGYVSVFVQPWYPNHTLYITSYYGLTKSAKNISFVTSYVVWYIFYFYPPNIETKTYHKIYTWLLFHTASLLEVLFWTPDFQEFGSCTGYQTMLKHPYFHP